MLLAARRAGLQCLAELDFGALLWSGPAIAITGTTGKLALAFNVHYLLDGLKAFRSSETVTLSANGATTPVVLTPTNAPDQTYLIMPVQIRS